MTKSSPRPLLLVALATVALSLAAFVYFFSHNMTNFYGDGIAHVNIARKVVDHPDDSLWQRYMQIGSPWLPLQTVLMLPLVGSDSLWRSGIAGSLISMLGFIIAALALFRMAQHLYGGEAKEYSQILPFVTVGIFACNPSVLFMQSTPMSELIFMASLAVAVWLMQEWAHNQTTRRLLLAALTMTVATMARYEAWPVAALACLLVLTCSQGGRTTKLKNTILFSALVVLLPLYWLWHNWAIYGDALWFLTGPHSARGIYLQNRANLGWSKIFVGHAVLDFLLMSVTVAACVGPLTILLGGLGFLRLLVNRKIKGIDYAPVILLATPFFFHCLSLYRGEIQIFPLTAFGLLNVRYGLPHVLLLSLMAPAIIPALRRLGRPAAILLVIAAILLQYGYLVSDGFSQLAVYQEGYRNGVNAIPARQWSRMAQFTREQPPQGTILMQTGSLGPVVSQGGLQFANIIHEGTTRWHQLEEGIPADVTTVIIETNDALDERIQNSESLRRDLAHSFQEQFAAGAIKLFRRRLIEEGG